jgi:hypothetical protein
MMAEEKQMFPVGEGIQIPVSQDKMSIREKIDLIEAEMKKAPQLEIATTHHFSKGLYAREIFIPKGTLLTGKIHKTEHLNIVSQGDISVLTEGGIKRVQAPFTMISSPGTKRIGYAHEDTVWTTIHATEETDLEKLEEELIAKTHDEALLTEDTVKQLKEDVCLG